MTAQTDWRREDLGEGFHRFRKNFTKEVYATITQTEDGAAECGTWTDLTIVGIDADPPFLMREFGQADGMERAKAYAEEVVARGRK